MTPDGPDPLDSIGASPREVRMGELINEFFDRRERGEDLTKDQFLAEHPDCSDELREHLGSLDLIAGLGSASSKGITLSKGDSFSPKGSSAEDPLGVAAQPHPNITGYEIHKLIGRGGMGLVYKATQLSTRRVVALKLLLEGPFASEGSRKRFEREVALAAQLRHPNIIPIYDSGNVEGRMFYAMEHVYGLALSDYVRANQIDLKARLRLFTKVCTAVSHAHLRGVVHRDLKPSNILVDGAGEPHILDFGLAKAGAMADMSTSITAQVIGTPAYMSPEQAAGDPSGIDIRTDVYSLGVILYEMLTSEMPYETNVAIGKILHNIAHVEPRPPGKVNSKIDSELTAIVLKALEKNKETRYQSVDSLASDVQRYLDGEPITARPPSAVYLLKKAVLKHRVGFGVAAALLVMAGASLLIVRRYSASLAAKEITLRKQEDETRVLQAQLDAKRQADDEARKQREAAQRQLDAVLRTMDDKTAKTMAPLLKGVVDIFSGEAAVPAVAEASQKVLSGLGGQPSDAPAKPLNVDLSGLMVSPRPADMPKEQSKPAISMDELRKAIETIRKYQDSVAPAAPASQPAGNAATQPTSQPVSESGS